MSDPTPPGSPVSPATDQEPAEGQVSEGPSAFGNAETAHGGADAVPDTPDINPGTPEALQD